jgi:hypothetical protein
VVTSLEFWVLVTFLVTTNSTRTSHISAVFFPPRFPKLSTRRNNHISCIWCPIDEFLYNLESLARALSNGSDLGQKFLLSTPQSRSRFAICCLNLKISIWVWSGYVQQSFCFDCCKIEQISLYFWRKKEKGKKEKKERKGSEVLFPLDSFTALVCDNACVQAHISNLFVP